MSQLQDMVALKQVVKNGIVVHEQLKAFVCESLLVLALGPTQQGPLTRQSKDIIRSQLATIAGGQVREALIQPALLNGARDAIG